MEHVFIKLLNMSITAGWMILAVILLRFLLKKAPKAIRCFLWMLVGIRLVFPFSWESIWSLIPSSHVISTDILTSETPAIHSGIDLLNRAVNPVLSESLAPDPYASANPMQIVTYMASVVWISGIVLLLLYSALSYLRLRRRLFDAVRLRDNIWQSEKAASPFVLGLFRPRIYLPYHLHDPGISHVVAHEQAHIQRRDHWVKPIAFLILTVYWFNPLIWLSYILLCRDIELACDERVVKEMDMENKKEYSEALLSLSVPRHTIAACPLAFGEAGVRQRIKNVLNYKKPAFWLILTALLSCVVLAVCFLTDPPGLRFDFEKNGLVSASACDLRKSSGPSTGELNPGELEELSRRLPEISGARQSDEYRGLTPFYYIEAKLADGSVLSINGYALDGGRSDVSFQDKRYIITDSDFSVYISSLCAGKDTIPADSGKGKDEPAAPEEKEEPAAPEENALPTLDESVSAAILEHNKGSSSDGEYACESHVTLATLPGERYSEDAGTTVSTIDVYAMALYMEFRYDGTSITDTGGSHLPCVLSFDLDENGKYNLTNYWEPRDGSYYGPDIEKRFGQLPAKTAAAAIAGAMDTQKYILAQTQSCYAQAAEYWQMDTHAFLGQLFDTILSSPAASSNPADYISEHPLKVRELTYYGDYTLRYIFSEFLAGGQTGLKGQLMRIVMDDLIGGEALDLEAATGQDYFDAWKASVQRRFKEEGPKRLKEEAPKSFLLLQMLGEL